MTVRSTREAAKYLLSLPGIGRRSRERFLHHFSIQYRSMWRIKKDLEQSAAAQAPDLAEIYLEILSKEWIYLSAKGYAEEDRRIGQLRFFIVTPALLLFLWLSVSTMVQVESALSLLIFISGLLTLGGTSVLAGAIFVVKPTYSGLRALVAMSGGLTLLTLVAHLASTLAVKGNLLQVHTGQPLEAVAVAAFVSLIGSLSLYVASVISARMTLNGRSHGYLKPAGAAIADLLHLAAASSAPRPFMVTVSAKFDAASRLDRLANTIEYELPSYLGANSGQEGADITDRFANAAEFFRNMKMWVTFPQAGTPSNFQKAVIESATAIMTGRYHYLPAGNPSTRSARVRVVRRIAFYAGRIIAATIPLAAVLSGNYLGLSYPSTLKQWLTGIAVFWLIGGLLSIFDVRNLASWSVLKDMHIPSGADSGSK